jgi:hypothetical protein
MFIVQATDVWVFQVSKSGKKGRKIRLRWQEARNEAKHEAKRRRHFRLPADQKTGKFKVRKIRKQETREGT